MIDARRRGELAAYEEICKGTWADASLYRPLAHIILARLRMQGYAHLEPADDFIEGFVTRFQQREAEEDEGYGRDNRLKSHRDAYEC